MVVILALLACAPEVEVTVETVETVETVTPDVERRCLVFEEEQLDFGSLEWLVDSLPRQATAHLRSECAFDVWIDEVRVDDPDSPFTATLEHPALHPGETSDVLVRFDPGQPGTWATSAVVYPERALTAWVDLRARVVSPVLEVEPRSVDLGDVAIGCEVEAEYTLSNVGTSELLIEDYDFATGSADFSFTPGELPVSLAPGGSEAVAIRYHPQDEFPDTAFLSIHSTDPLTPQHLVTAKGDGVVDPDCEEAP